MILDKQAVLIIAKKRAEQMGIDWPVDGKYAIGSTAHRAYEEALEISEALTVHQAKAEKQK